MEVLVHVGDSIQDAIDSMHEAGGGRVVLSPGSHHSGTIYMKSYVELHLPAGATLQGSSKVDDYDDFSDPGFEPVAPEKSRKCLIAGAHAEGIAITGGGEVNGAGPDFYDTNVPEGEFYAKPPHPRPRMLQLYNCRGVRIEGVSFIDSPGWTFWLIDCERVDIHRIRVEGCQQMINNDGIDLDGCRRVTVSDCVVRTGDDCIVVRAIPKGDGREVVCEGITVTNCVLDSWCQGIRIGCPSDDTVRNCTFSNLVIQGRGRGIHINNPKRYLRKGCSGFLNLHDLLFSNIVLSTGNVPIAINVEDGIRLRRLSDIVFTNLTIRSPQPCRLEGCSETTIEDISFNHVKTNRAMVIERCRNVVQHQFQIDTDKSE